MNLDHGYHSQFLLFWFVHAEEKTVRLSLAFLQHDENLLVLLYRMSSLWSLQIRFQLPTLENRSTRKELKEGATQNRGSYLGSTFKDYHAISKQMSPAFEPSIGLTKHQKKELHREEPSLTSLSSCSMTNRVQTVQHGGARAWKFYIASPWS